MRRGLRRWIGRGRCGMRWGCGRRAREKRSSAEGGEGEEEVETQHNRLVLTTILRLEQPWRMLLGKMLDRSVKELVGSIRPGDEASLRHVGVDVVPSDVYVDVPIARIDGHFGHDIDV